MQELGRNFNDLPARPPRPNSRGVGRSGAASGRAAGGSTSSTSPVDREVGGESKDNPDIVIVQAILSARQGAAGRKWSLEVDVAAKSGTVPKRPR